ncbi:tagaturonate epimerase family protein [Phycisphaerales bacterium AB-hyl4]|uniref:Tagaturonate/fructuronate epimerase n=1 Tax=Natronomicrosphaera hydrolytica TaxID=3242702 RepID=A0ABV4U6Z7_9BACT
MSGTQQSKPLGLKPTFGFGDRLGLATPGHFEACRQQAGPIRGIFAQQSIREMQRTNRTPDDVMNAAINDLKAVGYTGEWGSDADHLKTEKDVDYTAAAGFVFFTIDPSDDVDEQADDYDAATLDQRFAAVKGEVAWLDRYKGQTIQVPDGPEIHFDDTTLKRAAVKYGRAITHTIKLASYIHKVMTERGADYEIELSVDETAQPTTVAEHYIIADQCRENLPDPSKLVSLAPRYVGDFEKGIDFKGDIKLFEASLAEHVAIAEHLGPYKLSLHSGSDKLSVYRSFARITRGRFHVKTAGTSYLEALRAVARHEPDLFRRIIDFSRGRFAVDKATYHISADPDKVPVPAAVADAASLERIYLDENDGRQILHVTFGSVLTDDYLKAEMLRVLKAHPDTHKQVLAHHLGKHLELLREGMMEARDAHATDERHTWETASET